MLSFLRTVSISASVKIILNQLILALLELENATNTRVIKNIPKDQNLFDFDFHIYRANGFF